MASLPLRIAVAGGVPAPLGGGGLEIQRDATMDALRGMGHDVFHVSAARQPTPFDLLHLFGGEADAWHVLNHWRLNSAPLVVSPVVVVKPGGPERRLTLGSKVRRPMTVPRMRAEVLRAADLLIALTGFERALLKRLAPGVRSVVIGNGADVSSEGSVQRGLVRDLRAPYVLMVGHVSRRKRQLEAVRAIGSSEFQAVAVGGFHGSADELREFETAVATADALWLGEVDTGTVRALIRGASALVHFSEAEGQSLAILEALADGVPVICSPLPANLELAARYPGWVHICARVKDVGQLFGRLPVKGLERPAVPTWDDIAELVATEYVRVLSSARRVSERI